ncbi:HEAT repeat domain-containing protein [Kitasatospora kifunensis]|uniref:HEAT repeat protein n=1 Tax=Kitasatospora kifunensis TaxID=58351 RepID=A0A7W7QXK2_KITKI|nr:HEAT repeat domain-containing protein [Kitasatospora kifunensis]MBB4921564.1 HEAT repeat protein [Kitasatospora kifunensis]
MTSGDDDLEVLRAAALLDQDEHEYWRVVGEFHRRADRSAFEAACVVARAEDMCERMIGLSVLGQLGFGAGRPFLEETLPVVIEACDDRRTDVVQSAVVALSHLADPRGLAAVLGQEGHQDEEVRQAVAFALPSVAGDPACPEAVDALIRLSGDRSDYVRDWATFGLRLESTGDCERIRGALLERVGDPDSDTAGEAFLGLALRGDRRMLAALGAALEGRDPVDNLIEAAFELAAPELLLVLRRLKQREASGDDAQTSRLDEAIIACSTAP